MTTPPLISVVVPVEDSSVPVEESLQSIMDQTLADLEVIVVVAAAGVGAPGSASEQSRGEPYERVRGAVRSVGDARVHLLPGEHGSAGRARNTALERARGEFLVWQRPGDVSSPLRLERLLAAFAPGTGFVHHDVLLLDAQGAVRGYRRGANPRTEDLTRHLLRQGCPYDCATSMLRRTAVGRARHPEDVTTGAGVEFTRRFAPGTRGAHVPEPLVLRRAPARAPVPAEGGHDEFAPLARLLAQVPLPELVTDAVQDDWGPDQEAVALAFAGLCLARRRVPWWADVLDRAEAMSPTTTAGSAAVAAVRDLAEEAPSLALARLEGGADNSMTRVLRGQARAALGDLAAAAAEFRTALSLRPHSYDAVEGLRGVSEEMDLWDLDDPVRRLVGRYR